MFGSNGSSWSSRWDTARNFLDNNVAERGNGVFFSNIDNYPDDSATTTTPGRSGSVAPGSGGCSTSTDCASGWRCVSGECVPPQNTPGDPTGGGNDFGCGGGGGGGGYTPGGGGGQCSGGTAQTTSATGSGVRGGIRLSTLTGGCANASPGGNGCGGGGYDGGPGIDYPEATTGCDNNGGPNAPNPGACSGGRRCCRFRSRVNAVHCNCGDCGQNDVDCQKFCADHASATGESAGGCKKEVECDECSTCEWVGFSGTSDIHRCEPKEGGPCWCNNGSDCRECQTCLESGSCGYTAESQRACLPPPPPDPVEPPTPPGGECSRKCKYKNKCGSSESGTPAPSCGPGEKFVGRIETENGVCVICEYGCEQEGDCDPEPCDCSCNDDCPDCYICNETSGECEEDPACEGGYFGVRTSTYNCAAGTCLRRKYASTPCQPKPKGCPRLVGIEGDPKECGGIGVIQVFANWIWEDGEEFQMEIMGGFGYRTLFNSVSAVYSEFPIVSESEEIPC